MILAAYFDESGKHHGSKVLTVAGYVSTPERWLAFEKEWKVALAELNLARCRARTLVTAWDVAVSSS
jgi:hypothetical protein